MENIPENMVHISEFSKTNNMPNKRIIEMVIEGYYKGKKVGEDWYIEQPDSTSGDTMAVTTSSANSNIQEVQITDIKMPFMSMVVFMIKWAIASIPAAIILFVAFSLISSVFVGLFSR